MWVPAKALGNQGHRTARDPNNPPTIGNMRTLICVSPMSSGSLELGWLGVCEEVPVDDVGEFAFEESDGFSFGGAGFEASFDECLRLGGCASG